MVCLLSIFRFCRVFYSIFCMLCLSTAVSSAYCFFSRTSLIVNKTLHELIRLFDPAAQREVIERGLLECGLIRCLRIREDFRGRIVREQVTVRKNNGAVGVLQHQMHIVRNQDDRESHGPVQHPQKLHDLEFRDQYFHHHEQQPEGSGVLTFGDLRE